MKKILQSFSLLTIIVALAWPNLAKAAATQDPAAVDVINEQKPLAGDSTKPKLMVLKTKVNIVDNNIDPTALTNLISTVAAEHGTYKVLSYEDVGALLDHESQKQLVSCDETSCMAEIGQAMGAQFLLYAQVGQVGEAFVTTVNLLDVETAQVTSRKSLQIKQVVNLVDATRAACQQALGQTVEYREPAAVVSSTQEFNFLSPLKWTLLGAAGLVAAGGLGATGFAYYSLDQVNQATDDVKLTNFRDQAFFRQVAALSAYSVATLLAVGAGIVFVIYAYDDNAETTTTPTQKNAVEADDAR